MQARKAPEGFPEQAAATRSQPGTSSGPYFYPPLITQARSSLRELALSVGLGLGGTLLAILQALLLSRIIGRVFLGSQTWAQVASLAAVLLAAIAGRALATSGAELLASAAARRTKRGLRARLFQHLLRLGPAFSRGEHSGELALTAGDGIEALDAYYSQYLPQLVLAALSPLAVVLFVFPIDWISGLVLLLTGPLIPVFMILIGNAAGALTRRQWRGLSRMSAYFLSALQGLATLKAFGQSKAQAGVLAQVSERYRQATMSVLRVTFLSALALELAATLSTALVAVQVGLRLLYGRIEFEQAFFVLVLAPEFYLPLRALGARFHAGQAGVEAGKRIFEILDTPAAAPFAGQPSAQPAGPSSGTPVPGPIRFEQVSYCYPDGRQAVREVSFTLEAGQSLALVGPSGAGKTTLAYLLLGFLQPSQGNLWVGETRLPDIAIDAWRAQVAWVPQNPHLFNASLAENIRIGKPQASRAEVEQAARQAGLHEWILSQPQGYDLPLGEGGLRLSRGQAQLVALARAFLKNAPLVVLDEPTANLDPETQDRVGAAIYRLLHDRPALVIAHRLPTAARASRILVVQNGSLVAEGTHSALLERCDLYRLLASAYLAAGGQAL